MYYFILRRSLKSEVCVSGLEEGHASARRSLTASEVLFSPCLLPLPPVLWLFSVFYFRTASLTCQPPSSAFFLGPSQLLWSLQMIQNRFPVLRSLASSPSRQEGQGIYRLWELKCYLPLLKGGDISLPSIIQSLWGPCSSRVRISAQFWLWSPWSQPLTMNFFSLTVEQRVKPRGMSGENHCVAIGSRLGAL